LNLHDWTTYFVGGCVVSAGLGLTYYWENFDVVRFQEAREKQFNQPEIVQGMWRCGHTSGAIEAGMFVVFRRTGDGGQQHLARVVAIEGQKVEIKGADLLVDDKPYTIKGVKNPGTACESPTIVVPRHCLFVVCDERARNGSPEHDSRIYGPIPIEAVTHAFRPLEKKGT
jgi:signal peptidase I